ncbi:MAG: hypothetical protein M3P95_03445 [Actinomycetota bacterium]|jgi:uncharacterized protein YukE|nr:hypothetical protein [Actinomycetota bacterium]
MSGFRVEPEELTDRAGRLRGAAEGLRLTAGACGLDAGRRLRGGLDEALAAFVERWRDGHSALAGRTEEVALRLGQAAEVYAEVDREVARGAGA